MSWETNVYDNPEKHGLEIVGSLEDPEACYSFDDLIVWQHKETKKLYYATDSGCSCPSPFEDYNSVGDLEVITDDAESWNAFQNVVEDHAIGDWMTPEEKEEFKRRHSSFQADKTELLSKVARLLRECSSKQVGAK